MTGTGTQADPYIVGDWVDFITAVGTSGAYVEFPKNLVKTSDTEIVEGKLYVDSTGEPVTNPVPTNLGDYYENTFVLNQNDYAPEGITTVLEIRCANFNGYGGMITNIHFVRDGFLRATNASRVRNVNFDNWLIEEHNTNYVIYGGLFYKCIFSAQFFTDSTFIYGDGNDEPYGRPGYRRCSFYISSHTNITISINSTYFNTGSIYNRFYLDSTVGGSIRLYKINYSLVQGNVKGSLGIYESGSYSVVDCEVSGDVTINNVTHIINADKVGGRIIGGTSVTSEQMKDAAYLSSIGFPIQT